MCIEFFSIHIFVYYPVLKAFNDPNDTNDPKVFNDPV